MTAEGGMAMAQAPLALHIRRLRQWSGEQGLSQEELAQLAGLSLRQVRRYESNRALPQVLVALLSLGLALKVPIEELVNPQEVERLRQAIEERRSARSGINYGT